MTTIIPTPAPVPNPLSSDFGTKAYDFTVWMADAAPAMTAVAQETNDALNNSLLGMVSTTTSSITIAAPGGTVNFTTQANKGYAIGMTLKIASTANPANYVKVRLTAYNISTGVSAGTIISNGGSGTFANWSVFFDVPDPSVLSVPTGETVAAGALLAIDDAGNSMSAGSITTAVLQAVTATSMHACGLAGGNTAIFWTAGSTDVRMMIVSKTGSTVLGSTSVATTLNSGFIDSDELTNGNIVIVYLNASQYPCFKILNTSGATVVAETVIESSVANGQIKCTNVIGGFAVTYNLDLAANNRVVLYNNAGALAKSAATNVAGAQSNVAICQTVSGGYIALAGTATLTGNIYNSAGNFTSTCALSIPVGVNVGIASKSGSVVGGGRQNGTPFYGPTLHLASDSANSTINSHTTAASAYSQVMFDGMTGTNTALGMSNFSLLGDGNYLAIYSAAVSTSNEYPRFVIFNSIGQVIRSGICFTETTYSSKPAVFAIPKDTNGFSLIYLATNQNIKFAQIKSGNIVGVSLGAVGSNHQYLPNGSVTLASTSMINVGGAKVNYKQQGEKVVI